MEQCINRYVADWRCWHKGDYCSIIPAKAKRLARVFRRGGPSDRVGLSCTC